MATPFTQTALRKLVGRIGERATVHDDKTPGLRAELREGGRVSFYLFKRMPGGGPIRKRLGGFPELTVEDARQHAANALGEMAKGINPAKASRDRRREATVKELFAHWIENHAKPHKKTWREDERQYNVYLAAWKNRKLSDVTAAEVQSLCSKLGDKHGKYTANRVLSLLRAAFNEAEKIGYRGPNPAAGVKRFKEASRDRFLQVEELPRFFAAVAAETNATLRDFFLLALFTGARRSNVCAMRWEQIDLTRGEWRIPDTKAGRPQIVYLPEPALRLLAERKKAAGRRPWVLPGRGESGHLTEPKIAWKRLTERAGIKNLRIHDLRRTLGSYQAIQGASLTIIGASLGHSQAQTTQVYARLTTNAVAESVNKAVGFIVATAAAEGDRDGEA